MASTTRGGRDARAARSGIRRIQRESARRAGQKKGQGTDQTAQVRTAPLDPDGRFALTALTAVDAGFKGDALADLVDDVERRYSADLRGQVWSLHLRGHSFRAIGQELHVYRESVARIVRACYAELGQDHEEALQGAQDEAIARLRHIQRQVWADHDLDAEREASALAQGADGPRFTSQRAQYLRLALDCEREIARLRGLYGVAAPLDDARPGGVQHRAGRGPRPPALPATDPALAPAPVDGANVVEAGE